MAPEQANRQEERRTILTTHRSNMAPAVDSEVDVVKCFPIDRVTLQVQHLLQKFLQVQLRQLQGHRRQGPTGPLNQQHLQKQDQRPALNYYNAPESQPSCLKAACTRR